MSTQTNSIHWCLNPDCLCEMDGFLSIEQLNIHMAEEHDEYPTIIEEVIEQFEQVTMYSTTDNIEPVSVCTVTETLEQIEDQKEQVEENNEVQIKTLS